MLHRNQNDNNPKIEQQIQGDDNVQVVGSATINKITSHTGYDTMVTATLIGILVLWLIVPYISSAGTYESRMLSFVCNSILCIFTPMALILGVYSAIRMRWFNLILGALYIFLIINKFINY